MKFVVGRSNAALTVSAELQKILLMHRVAFLLSLPQKDRLFFLAGLLRLALSRVAQITALITRSEEPVVRTILETVCKPIIKTGPPTLVAQPNQPSRISSAFSRNRTAANNVNY